MESPLQNDIHAEFKEAKESRDGARYQIWLMRDLLAKAGNEIRTTRESVRENQELHDQMQRQADRLFRSGNAKKGRDKVARRNKFGAATRESRAKLRELSAHTAELEEQLRWLKAELDIPMRDDRYCRARHAIMEALYDAERFDEQALLKKAEYVYNAGIPASVPLDEILYYLDDSKVHLFYGGHESPDGAGHGHYVLAVGADGTYTILYERMPR